MGRDFIGERTIADPRERAAGHARRRRQAAAQRRAEAAALLRYQARARLCHAAGCSRPASTGEESAYPCCSAACLTRWTAALERRDEVRQARRLGMPVAEYRAGKAAP